MKASIAELVRLPGVWRGGDLESAGAQATAATGHAPLDAELPGGGWPMGTLAEVLHDDSGIGEVTFLAGALARASEGERLVLWIRPPHLPYAPALAQAGLVLERCLVARPATREDALWTAEQALKSGACGAVLLWLEAPFASERSAPAPQRERANDYAALRRLQLAAGAGRAMAVLFRPSAAEKLSSPAHLRVALAAGKEGALRIRIPKRRGPPLAREVVLPLARPGVPRRAVEGARVTIASRRGAAQPGQPPLSPRERTLHLVGR